MNNRSRRAREIQGQIREIINKDWDPEGLIAWGFPDDEYDSWIGPVYHLLAGGCTARRMARYLAEFNADSIDRMLPVARKLCALDVALPTADGTESR